MAGGLPARAQPGAGRPVRAGGGRRRCLPRLPARGGGQLLPRGQPGACSGRAGGAPAALVVRRVRACMQCPSPVVDCAQCCARCAAGGMRACHTLDLVWSPFGQSKARSGHLAILNVGHALIKPSRGGLAASQRHLQEDTRIGAVVHGLCFIRLPRRGLCTITECSAEPLGPLVRGSQQVSWCPVRARHQALQRETLQRFFRPLQHC